uniref:PH domain-containing protein n=1 Tax=Chromera velia CCMP2878 TaxID=1169474 RepID=A0A0G4FLC0_9ALVE|eukprot:Cvel_17620.t1-p1 / transcript=Cvel_17620.t1 / gene=Cvel_17620 / organism=Chromera_velia_CCMP2878 / gene_product=hypothetical protein / transcript_product=hypothetical protein / location=Cvel_scaffold1418:2726-4915(-) / protein_length=297 / sequence_SO=supercontig / SO=protein_coding / is_pseudo=false
MDQLKDYTRQLGTKIAAAQMMGRAQQGFTQLQTGMGLNSNTAAPTAAHTGAAGEGGGNGPSTRCSKCSSEFKIWFPSFTCPSCGGAFCIQCYGLGALLKCCLESPCAACGEKRAGAERFSAESLPFLEEGAACTLHKPGVLGSARTPILVSFDREAVMFCWQTMENRNNLPVDSGKIPVELVDRIEDTFTTPNTLVVYSRGAPVLVAEFSDAPTHKKWVDAMRGAVKHMAADGSAKRADAQQGGSVPQQQQQQQQQKQSLEERRKEREERKKQLMGGKQGMRFTAEAMMRMGEEQGK